MGDKMPSNTVENFKERIAKVLTLSPDSNALAFKDQTATWGELRDIAEKIDRLLCEAGIDPSAPIGWAARNRPSAVAGFLSLLGNGRMVVPLRPNFSQNNFNEDIVSQRLQAVIGDPEDWAGPGAIDAAKAAGSVGLSVSGLPFCAQLHPELAELGAGPHREAMPGFVLERLTSGTTGEPKRIPVSGAVLLPSLASGAQSDKPEELTLKRSPSLLFKPFSHAGGLFGLLLSLYQARPIVLFEKFSVDEWVAAVHEYKPKSASLVPAMIRMVLDANPDPEHLASLLAIRSGTAPLEPELQEAFEQRFGVPILIDYGAAEFIGGLAGWTLNAYKKYGKEKRGSVGRSRSDVEIRVIDSETDSPLSTDEIGLVEVKSARYGPDWIRTNDLAQIDQDGFIFLRGRADDAINRGGFKVLPEEVAAVLRSHQGVADAAVVAKPDDRLGQVPIAAIEPKDHTKPPDTDELTALIRAQMPAYMVPVDYQMVEELPRTESMKVSRPRLKALLGV